MAKQVTAFDVAQKAGVSQGTVDRVIHNRGEVSAKTKAKVMQAIEELGFKVNIMASVLAKRKEMVIACLLPSFREGEYWEMIYNGFTRTAGTTSAMGVSTRTFFYDQHEASTFDSAARQLLDSEPAGVVIAPLFSAQSQAFTQILDERHIPYVFVDTKVDGTNYLAYFGMPGYKSGYLCGALLSIDGAERKLERVAAVRLSREEYDIDPSQNRSQGFAAYIHEHHPDCEIVNITLKTSDPLTVSAELESFFDKYKDIKDIAFLNSRLYLTSKYLADNPDPSRRVVGYDSLPQNMAMLREGLVSALVAQHTEEQSKLAVETLTQYLLMHKLPPRKDSNMHMDILTRFNCEDYE